MRRHFDKCLGCEANLPVSDELLHYSGDQAVLACTRFIAEKQHAMDVSRSDLVEELAHTLADHYGLVGDTRDQALPAYRREAESLYDVLLALFGKAIKRLRDV